MSQYELWNWNALLMYQNVPRRTQRVIKVRPISAPLAAIFDNIKILAYILVQIHE